MAWQTICSSSPSTSSCLLTATLQNPNGQLFLRFLQQPNIPYPGNPDANPDPQAFGYFTENSIGLGMSPLVYLDIQEHHKICECALSPNVSESHPYVAPTYTSTPLNATGVPSSSSILPTSVPIELQSGRCGVVPIPAPLVFQQSTQGTGQNQEGDGTQASDALTLSLPTPKVNVIDYSMSNAWFPGHLGGVSFSKLPTSLTEYGKRDKIICAVDFQAPDIRNVLTRLEESECLALGGRKRQDGQGKMNAFVYETYDPEKTSMHRGLNGSTSDAGTNAFISASSSNDYPTDDPHKCQRCLQREALIRLERKKAEQRSKTMLDRGLRSFGSTGGYNWGQDDYDDDDMDDDDDEDEEMRVDDEEDEDEDEDDEMRDVDVDELGIDVDGIVAQTTSRSTGSASSNATDDDSMSSSQLVSFGDDDTEKYLDADVRQRKIYDKCRVGVECNGVADVLLSGEVGFFFF